MKTKQIVSFVAVLLVVGLAGVSLARPMGGPQGMGPDLGRGMGRLLHQKNWSEKLGLSAEEEQTVQDAWYAHREAMIPLQAALETAELAQERLVESTDTDTAAVMAAVESVGQARIAMDKERISFFMKLKSILGPERVAKLQSQIGRRMQARREGRGRGQGKGQGPQGWRQGDLPPPEDNPEG